MPRHWCATLCNGSHKAQAGACAATREPGYATNSAGGRGASAAGPEIPKEAGPRRRAQRRGAGDAGGIPTRSMRPHRRTDARPYAERGIAGGAGMRRSAANAPRATAGCIGPPRGTDRCEKPRTGRPRRQSSDCRKMRRRKRSFRREDSAKPNPKGAQASAVGRNAGCAFRAGVLLGRCSPQIRARQADQYGKLIFSGFRSATQTRRRLRRLTTSPRG